MEGPQKPDRVVGKEEGRRPTFEQAVELGVQNALTRVKQRFEQAENPFDNLAYHNTIHTETVIRRTKIILETIEKAVPGSLTKRLIMLGEYIAANHDTVQEYEILEQEDGTKIRNRFTEKNEAASSEEAIQHIRAIDAELLTSEEEKLVREAIDATVPEYNPELGTVVQPSLTKHSELVIRALALADLGAAGMDEPDSFISEGDANFREENIDITDALEHPENLSDAQKDFFKKRMLDWSNGQSNFAKGRKALLDKELDGLPEEAQRAVAGLFNKFDENIQNSQERNDVRKDMSFEELARDFGYNIS